MPSGDVDVKATVGTPETLNIGGKTVNLINGALKDGSGNEISGLSWSYFTSILTMNSYNGTYIRKASLEDITIKLVGANELTGGWEILVFESLTIMCATCIISDNISLSWANVIFGVVSY